MRSRCFPLQENKKNNSASDASLTGPIVLHLYGPRWHADINLVIIAAAIDALAAPCSLFFLRCCHTHMHTLPLTPINLHVISHNNPCTPCPCIDLAPIVPLLFLPPSFLRSWSCKPATSPTCQWESTAPSRTTWRQRDTSRGGTSTACPPPSETSSPSPGTKVGTRDLFWSFGLIRFLIMFFLCIIFFST